MNAFAVRFLPAPAANLASFAGGVPARFVSGHFLRADGAERTLPRSRILWTRKV